jgi:hypothetical protein
MKTSTRIKITFIICGLLFSSKAWSQLTVTLTSLNPVCDHNGTVVASIQNGFTTNTFHWYANGLTINHTHGYSTDTIFNFTGGYITVQVVPGNGANPAYQWINVPFPFNVTSTIVPDSCPVQNGSISLLVNGGAQPYTYSWTFNGNPFPGNTSSLSNLSGGNYDCHITDANGCNMFLHEADSSVGLVVYSINNINISMSATPANCVNGTATAAVLGGTAPYSYLWSNGQTTVTATGLTANNGYQVTVTDINGCFKMGYVNISSTSSFNIILSTTNAHCTFSDGAISAIATGGMPPYSYLWNTMAVTSSIQNIPARGIQYIGYGRKRLYGQPIFQCTKSHTGKCHMLCNSIAMHYRNRKCYRQCIRWNGPLYVFVVFKSTAEFTNSNQPGNREL